MKTKILILLILVSSVASAQIDTSYQDADQGSTTRERSVFYTTRVQEAGMWKYKMRFSRGGKLRRVYVVSDTATMKPAGEWLSYYSPSGKTEDSIIYQADGKLQEYYHFYENGEIAGHYYIIETTGKEVTEGFDENGLKLKSYTLAKEAEFPGGDAAWKDYLGKTARKDILVRGKQQQTVSVQLQFAVDGAGNVTGVKVLKSSSNPIVDKDAVGIITSSPKWVNAIQYNKPVKVYRLQTLTYVLEPMNKN